MVGARPRREADSSERQRAAHRLADGTRPGLAASATRHPLLRTYARHATRVKLTRLDPSSSGGSPASTSWMALDRASSSGAVAHALSLSLTGARVDCSVCLDAAPQRTTRPAVVARGW